MSSFQYLAIDPKGNLEKGIIDADSAKSARQLLRAKNLIPTEIHPYTHHSRAAFFKKPSLASFSLKSFFARNALASKELTLITRQLATLFSAGLPISEVLSAVAEQNANPRTRSILLAVKTKVMEGHALASALRDFPRSFSALFCGIVASGEKSGNLAAVLQRLADYTEQQHKFKQKMVAALVYPAALVFVSLLIMIFLLEYVVPKMVAVYSHLNQTLPLLTRLLISFSDNLKAGGLYLLVVAVAAFWGFRATLKRKPDFREKFHRFLLRVPLLGKTLQSINTARYARTLAMLGAAGIPLVEGMASVSALISLLPIRFAVEEAAKQVREGAAIYLALKQTGFFSPMSIHLIASGEASGQLEALLERAAIQQEEEITQLSATLLTLFEPALILLMGGIVLFIVLAVLLPIFDLNQLTL